jgi:hypothetical protein
MDIVVESHGTHRIKTLHRFKFMVAKSYSIQLRSAADELHFNKIS